ncbi:MAG: hypothetical protein JXX28_04950, partial [Deltaproteobacteria bacterium]|nr:hypothetical protein [Deltaproteobacteria bacterium]
TADVSRCRGCGLVQTRPRLSEEALSTFYDEGYTEFLEGYDPDGRGADWLNDYRLTVIRKVHPLGPEDRLLDVGCNQGRGCGGFGTRGPSVVTWAKGGGRHHATEKLRYDRGGEPTDHARRVRGLGERAEVLGFEATAGPSAVVLGGVA